MASPLFADAIRPESGRRAWLFDAALIAGSSLVIGLCAQIAIPLPFTPVPVTLQTLAVLMVGCALGSERGTLAVLAYLGEGFAGLPVFSGGRAGAACLFGPTGGYLLGFLAAAYVVGLLAERGMLRRGIGALLALAAGNIILYVPGVLWLGAYAGMGKALSLGIVPFLAGDAAKIAAAWGLLSGAALVVTKARST